MTDGQVTDWAVTAWAGEKFTVLNEQNATHHTEQFPATLTCILA